MVKKLLLGLGLVAFFPTSAFASTLALEQELTVKPEILPIPLPIVRHYTASPGHPVFLEGCGYQKASGKGTVTFRDFRGNTEINGKGWVAVKREDGTEFKKDGFRRVFAHAGWVFFQGRGVFYAQGSSLDLKFWGKADLKAQGCGDTTYRKDWEIDVWSRIKIKPSPLPEPIELDNVQIDLEAN